MNSEKSKKKSQKESKKITKKSKNFPKKSKKFNQEIHITMVFAFVFQKMYTLYVWSILLPKPQSAKIRMVLQ